MTHRCVIGVRCRLHGYVHGKEAEELRAGLEKLLEHAHDGELTFGAVVRLLDRIDARDSLAYCEASPTRETTEGGKR